MALEICRDVTEHDDFILERTRYLLISPWLEDCLSELRWDLQQGVAIPGRRVGSGYLAVLRAPPNIPDSNYSLLLVVVPNDDDGALEAIDLRQMVRLV